MCSVIAAPEAICVCLSHFLACISVATTGLCHPIGSWPGYDITRPTCNTVQSCNSGAVCAAGYTGVPLISCPENGREFVLDGCEGVATSCVYVCGGAFLVIVALVDVFT